MERIAILVASAPGTASAQRAFELVRSLAAQGDQVNLCLLEDGVYAAAGDAPFAACANVMALTPDLGLRGLAGSDLNAACRPCSYGEIIELMMTGSDRTLGAF